MQTARSVPEEGSAALARPGRSKLLRREAWEGRIFALPFMLGFLIWWVYPLAYSIILIFQE